MDILEQPYWIWNFLPEKFLHFLRRKTDFKAIQLIFSTWKFLSSNCSWNSETSKLENYWNTPIECWIYSRKSRFGLIVTKVRSSTCFCLFCMSLLNAFFQTGPLISLGSISFVSEWRGFFYVYFFLPLHNYALLSVGLSQKVLIK